MKIVYLPYYFWPPGFGGELLIRKECFKSLVKRGHAVVVFTCGAQGYPRYEIVEGIQVFRSPLLSPTSYLQPLIYNIWVIWKLGHCKPDAVQIGNLGALDHVGKFSVINLILKILRNAIINYLHYKGIPTYYVYSLADTPEHPVEFSGLSSGLKKRFMQSIDYIVAVAPAIFDSLKHQLPLSNPVLILNGVQNDIFKPQNELERNTIRNDLDIQSSDVVFSFIGFVNHRKGFDLLAKAFAELSPEYPHWKLLVIGPKNNLECGDLSNDEVNQIIAPLDQNAQVLFLGRVDDRVKLAGLLAASDVFVFPSRNEGMPLAPLEAMSVGIPVIISRLQGITDLVNIDGETGFYIPPDNIEALKDAMLKLGCNDALRKHMGLKARDAIVDRFGWLHYVDQWEQLYRGECD